MKQLLVLVVSVLVSGSVFAQDDLKTGHYPLRDGRYAATNHEDFPFLFHVKESSVSLVFFGHFICEEITPGIYDCSNREEFIYFSIDLSEGEISARRSVPRFGEWFLGEKLEVKAMPILLEWREPYPEVQFKATPEGLIQD